MSKRKRRLMLWSGSMGRLIFLPKSAQKVIFIQRDHKLSIQSPLLKLTWT